MCLDCILKCCYSYSTHNLNSSGVGDTFPIRANDISIVMCMRITSVLTLAEVFLTQGHETTYMDLYDQWTQSRIVINAKGIRGTSATNRTKEKEVRKRQAKRAREDDSLWRRHHTWEERTRSSSKKKWFCGNDEQAGWGNDQGATTWGNNQATSWGTSSSFGRETGNAK